MSAFGAGGWVFHCSEPFGSAPAGGGDPVEDTVAYGEEAATRGAAAAFVGTWNATESEMNDRCPSYAPESNVTARRLTWTLDAEGRLLATGTGGFCPFTARVSGATASMDLAEGCLASDGAYGFFEVGRASYTFTLDPDGTAATERTAGNISYQNEGRVVFVCDYHGERRYRRASPPMVSTE